MGVNPEKLEILPSPNGSVNRRCPDVTRMMALVDFKKYTPLKEGLTKTIESLI